MNIEIWLQLVAICLLGAMSPGPSLALIVTNTFAGGRTYGIITSLAHGVGIGIWAFFTAIGIAGLLVNESGIMLSMQFVGACLIAYIGFRTIFSNNEVSIEQNDIKSTGSRTLLRGASEGFLISILNPKIALFFLATCFVGALTPPIPPVLILGVLQNGAMRLNFGAQLHTLRCSLRALGSPHSKI